MAEVIRERLDDLGIDEVEQHRPLIDQRHLRAEGAQHRRVFQPDHTAADDDGRLRNALELVDRVGVENPWRTDWNLRVLGGPAATRDQMRVRRKPLRVVRRLDAHGAIVGEARLALGHDHAVALQLSANDLVFTLHHRAQAAREIRHVDLILQAVLAAVERALIETGEIQDGFPECLAGDRTRPELHAAERLALFDHQHALAELGGSNRGTLSVRAAADHDEVVVRSRMAYGTHARSRFDRHSPQRIGHLARRSDAALRILLDTLHDKRGEVGAAARLELVDARRRLAGHGAEGRER